MPIKLGLVSEIGYKQYTKPNFLNLHTDFTDLCSLDNIRSLN